MAVAAVAVARRAAEQRAHERTASNRPSFAMRQARSPVANPALCATCLRGPSRERRAHDRPTPCWQRRMRRGRSLWLRAALATECSTCCCRPPAALPTTRSPTTSPSTRRSRSVRWVTSKISTVEGRRRPCAQSHPPPRSPRLPPRTGSSITRAGSSMGLAGSSKPRTRGRKPLTGSSVGPAGSSVARAGSSVAHAGSSVSPAGSSVSANSPSAGHSLRMIRQFSNSNDEPLGRHKIRTLELAHARGPNTDFHSPGGAVRTRALRRHWRDCIAHGYG